jgi:hypothetical protein
VIRGHCDTMKAGSFLVAVALGFGLVIAFAQPGPVQPTKAFMRDKLDLSKKVLEGLALEDFDLMFAESSRLAAMTSESRWRVFENPDYDLQSDLFRRQVNSLAKAARERNLDAATLAYVRMTMSCVDCHKLVRRKFVADLQSPSNKPRTKP